jgi:prepilin-type N-terminal cleavage/methylation domain-containing protein
MLARAGHRTSAFTLIEVLVVIAIAAAIAGTVAIGVARSSPERALSRALGEAATELTLARVEAMQRGEAAAVEMWVTPDQIHLARGDRERKWTVAKASIVPVAGVTTRLQRVEADAGPHGGIVAAFDTMGRTRERRWEVWTEGAPDRIWAIVFDPVSGEPRVRKPGAPTDAWN